MSKSGIRRKHDENAMQVHRRSLPASHPYKEGPPGRANRGATEDARKDKVKGPPVRLPKEDKDEGTPCRSLPPSLLRDTLSSKVCR